MQWPQKMESREMKEYRLSAWPELSAPFDRIAYRRMATDMSHRYMSLDQLLESSGVKRHEVRAFIEMLATQGLLVERNCFPSASNFSPLRPLADWLRRAFSTSAQFGR
jgi:hypothetical protein